MKFTRTLKTSLLAIACLGVVYGFSDKPNNKIKDTTPKPSVAIPKPTNAVYYTTCENIPIEKLYEKVILAEIKNIAAEYPIEEMRSEMKEFIALLDTMTVPVVVDVRHHPLFSIPPFMATLRKNEQGKNEKAVVITASETLHFWVEHECDRNILRDFIAQVILHENYHLKHHVGRIPKASPLDDETDAWVYGVEHHIKPALKIGRLENQKTKFRFWENVLDAYNKEGRKGVKKLIKIAYK
ncbi:MAG: hypothetical protein AAB870_00975 [Patescibacteria group bacterium]|mgnify:CR=1 FL=1